MAGFTRTVASSCFLLLLMSLAFSFSEAREFIVGGKPGAWKIPSSQADSLNAWAESSRFRNGDTLVWKYDGAKDSVLQVTRENYVNCNTTDPIKEYKDGNTSVVLDRSGPFYFISGAEGHCEKGQKLIVVVMSPRHGRYTAISPAPAPMVEIEGPAVAPSPTSGVNGLRGSVVMGLGVLLLVGFGLF